MKKKARRKSVKTQSGTPVRASISFPPGLYEILEKIAERKKVSLAWVVRDAAEKYAVSEAKQGRGRTPAGPEN
jgi:hypothetical protein